MLLKQAIDEFKELYQKDTGIILSDAEATEQANRFFSAMESLLDNDPSKMEL